MNVNETRSYSHPHPQGDQSIELIKFYLEHLLGRI